MQTKDTVETAVAVGSLLLLAAMSLVVARAVNDLWVAERVFYTVADALAIPFGNNRDVPVLLPVGVMTGWFLLFVFDGTKRVQGALVSVALAVSVGGYLRRTGRILEAIGRTPVAFAVGVALGLVTGLVSAELFGVKRPNDVGLAETLAWLQFPTATEAFRHGVAIVVLVTVVDYALFAPPVAAASVAVAGLLLLLSLSVFMRYGYQRDVVSLSPPDPENRRKYQSYVVGGLFATAHAEYHGYTIQNGGDLVQARIAQNHRELPTFTDEAGGNRPTATDAVSFGFASGLHSNTTGGLERLGSRLLPRTATIESRGYTTRELPSPTQFGGASTPVRYAQLLSDGIRRHLVTLVPKLIRDRVPGRGLSAMDRFDSADTVLLIGPTLGDPEPRPEGLSVFGHICERYAADPTTEVLLATTEAETVMESGSFAIDDEKVKLLARDRLGLARDDLSSFDVYPLTRFTEDGPGGFEPLLRRLSE